MSVKKIRIDVYDDMGEKHTITFQGRITGDKAIRVLDLVDLLGGIRRLSKEPKRAWQKKKVTKFERVRSLIEKHFPLTWFSSEELKSAYNEEFKEPINPGTIYTYLSRLANRGFLIKSRKGRIARYKHVTEVVKHFWLKDKPIKRLV